MGKRKTTSVNAETNVLVRSRRRCCFCFGLQGDITEKYGQIAHVDGNPGNPCEDNLAFLCFDHHSEFDSRSRQSKGLTVAELKHHRSRLYEALENGLHISDGGVASVNILSNEDRALLETIRHNALEWYNEIIKTVGQIMTVQNWDDFQRLEFEYSHSRKYLTELVAIQGVLSSRIGMTELAKDLENFIYVLTGGSARDDHLTFT